MKLNIVSCTTGILRFASESYVFLNNMRERNLSSSTHLLVWIPYSELGNQIHPLWDKLVKDFPEANIRFIRDNENFQKLGNTFNYLQLFRVYILSKYFKQNPHLEKEAIFYVDTDILLTKDFDFSPYLDNDICYLSDTCSYINAAYFDTKGRANEDGTPEFVNPQKWEEYKKRDILNETAAFCGIDRAECEKHQLHSGGAQYLMKGITWKFWEDVLESTMNIKTHLANVNQHFMQGNNPQEREDKGFQSWCADMWGVLWTLWRYGKEVVVPPEFNFGWATDYRDSLNDKFIFHNAGITGEETIRSSIRVDGKPVYIDAPAFFKSRQAFFTGTFFDNVAYLNNIVNNEESKKWGTSLYAETVLRVKYIYNL